MNRIWCSVLVIVAPVAACSGDGTGPGPVPPPPSQTPTLDNAPPLSADHNRVWEFRVAVSDPQGDPVTLSVVERPGWMEFDDAEHRLFGIAGWENVGAHSLRLRVSDGSNATNRGFTIQVVKGEIICDQDFGDPAESPYVLPFPTGRTYEIIQGYCPSNPTWGHHNWFAYDFEMPIGDTIVASRAGVVTAVRDHNPDGTRVCGQENWVFMGHDDGTRMSYVHITTGGALVAAGDTVAQGQPIALSGDSGCSSGPHLHVALFRDNTDFGRQATLPINYRNAIGSLDPNRGLAQRETYTAGSN